VGQNRTEIKLRSERTNFFSIRAFRSQNITSVSGLGILGLNALGNSRSIQLRLQWRVGPYAEH